VSHLDNYGTFSQTLDLPSSGWVCSGWGVLEAYIEPAVGGKLYCSAQPLRIQPESGNCNVCRNVGEFSTLVASFPRRQKLHLEFRPRKPKDRKPVRVALFWLITNRTSSTFTVMVSLIYACHASYSGCLSLRRPCENKSSVYFTEKTRCRKRETIRDIAGGHESWCEILQAARLCDGFVFSRLLVSSWWRTGTLPT
jgi:hypothetical protein